ncbi:hypothetical protein DPMN_171680 [Dreissena polymorpha]|uniref:B box-type domain-containing protein n=1 Tax=Dreissena polymorpha TaxID=45954 RepID=A0A9D4E0V9_DREPO|nr:hypothetical protein DPMN_171680 [Dreissena polymorpha]
MAFSSSVKGSDEVKDYICNACEDQNNEETSADFYCKQCDRFYCGNCIDHHGKALAKHTAFGRVDIDKWPVSKKDLDFLQTCDEHRNNKLDKFCKEHRQLCCPQCVSDQHSQCSKVFPISGLTSTQSTDLQGLSMKLETILRDMKSLQKNQEASMQTLQGSYTEHEGSVIQQLCLNINTTVDACSDSTVSMSDENEQYIKDNLCKSVNSILGKFDCSTVKELIDIKDEVKNIQGSITDSFYKCIRLNNELSRYHDLIQKIGDNKELYFIATVKCEQALTMLGKSGHVFTVQGKSEHNVKIPSDSDTCCIAAICVIPNGQVLLADSSNKTVKLLDQQYWVVSHCSVNSEPRGMCEITPSNVAVVLNDDNTHEVQFITVSQSQLFPGRKFWLQHRCEGIAHDQGDLFIWSDTALFKYSLSGKQVCRLYQDISGDYTVNFSYDDTVNFNEAWPHYQPWGTPPT